jgi:hypothetical protein
MTFTLRIDIETDGETEDAVYHWLTNKLFEIDGVTDVTEITEGGE